MYYAQLFHERLDYLPRLNQQSALQIAADRVRKYIDFKTQPEFLTEFGENCYSSIDVNLYYYRNQEPDISYFEDKFGDEKDQTINDICMAFHSRSEENRLERLYNNTTLWTQGESCVNILFRLLQKLCVEELSKARYDRTKAECCFNNIVVLRQ